MVSLSTYQLTSSGNETTMLASMLDESTSVCSFHVTAWRASSEVMVTVGSSTMRRLLIPTVCALTYGLLLWFAYLPSPRE